MNVCRTFCCAVSWAVICVCVLTVVGCARQFTRANFDVIQRGVDDREDVQRILGKPEVTQADVWFYQDMDRSLHAEIWFDDAGRVAGKEWMDANTGEWEGRNPHADEPPPGEVRHRNTKTRTIDDDD